MQRPELSRTLLEPKKLTAMSSAVTQNAHFELFNLSQNGFQFELISCSSDSWTTGNRPKRVKQRMELSEPPLDIGYVRGDPFGIRNADLMPSDERLEPLVGKVTDLPQTADRNHEPTCSNHGS